MSKLEELEQRAEQVEAYVNKIVNMETLIEQSIAMLKNPEITEELKAILEQFVEDQFEKLFPGTLIEPEVSQAKISISFDKEEYEKFLEDYKKLQDLAKPVWDPNNWIFPNPYNPNAPWIRYYYQPTYTTGVQS